MATEHLRGMLRQLRRVTLGRDGEELSDGQLLEAFLRDQDEGVFETLLWRHGPMVLGVCQRVLGPSPDAEDAFQAAFLVLVRKAASIRPRDRVGNWLYGVAYRTALKAKATAARRRTREKQLIDLPAREVHDDEVWHEMKPLLDQELARLADKYRAAVVLCDLEGKSRRAAARQLGWPEGTLSTRLTRGRRILAQRLTRRGVALSAGALGGVLTQSAALAGVPALLSISTVKAAVLTAAGQAATAGIPAPVAALTEGVLQAMFLTKIKSMLTVLVLVGVLMSGAGAFGLRGIAGSSAAAEPLAQVQRGSVAKVPAAEAAAIAVALAQRPEAFGRAAPRREVQGIVKEVNAGASTISIATGGSREGPATDMSFSLAKDVEVAVGVGSIGRASLLQEGKLADLAAGVRVSLTLSADEKQVESILAEGATVRGQVKAVDPTKQTLTLVGARGREGAVEEKTYPLAANAEVVIDDGRGRRFSFKEAKLADVAQGAVVTAQLTLDGKSIQSVLAEGPTVSGVVKAVDPAKKTLTLMTRPGRGDDAGAEQTLAVSPDAVVVLDDGRGRRLSLKQGSLADIPVGAAAAVRLAVDQSQVMSLRAEGPTVSGLLKSVDPEKGLITIRIPRGREEADEKSYTVAKDARITLDGAEAKLDSLKVSDNGPVLQLRLTLDQKAVQAITARQIMGR